MIQCSNSHAQQHFGQSLPYSHAQDNCPSSSGCRRITVDVAQAVVLSHNYGYGMVNLTEYTSFFGHANAMSISPSPMFYTSGEAKVTATTLCAPASVAACLQTMPGSCYYPVSYCDSDSADNGSDVCSDEATRLTLQCQARPVCVTDPCAGSEDPCCRFEGSLCSSKATPFLPSTVGTLVLLFCY